MHSEGLTKRKVELAAAYDAALGHFTAARRHHAHGDPSLAGDALGRCRDAIAGLMAMAAEDAASPQEPPASAPVRRGSVKSGVSARRFRLFKAVEGGGWAVAGSGTAASLAREFDVTPPQVYTMARSGNPSRGGRWRVEELRTPTF